MRICVLGAGGLGGYLGALLTRAGHPTLLVARGAHLVAMRRDGLRITDPAGEYRVDVECAESAKDLDWADLVFVTVKTYSLAEVAAEVCRLAEGGALVVPFLNGVEAESRLREVGVPADRLAPGVGYVTAFRTAPGVISRRGTLARILVGSTDGASRSRLPQVVEAFAGTGVDLVIAEDIQVQVWLKMAVVCVLAALCVTTGTGIGAVRDRPLGADLQRRGIGEVVAVGRAMGVAWPGDVAERVGHVLDRLPGDFYPSLVHDLKVGQRTEIDDLCGAVSRLGRDVGVETPVHDLVTLRVEVTEGGASPTVETV